MDEIKRNGPIMHPYSALCGIAQRKFGLEERKSSIRSATAFGVLLNMRNRKINAIQLINASFIQRKGQSEGNIEMLTCLSNLWAIVRHIVNLFLRFHVPSPGDVHSN